MAGRGNELRLEFLDALRAIAAIAVALQHMAGALFSDFSHFTANYFQLGQFGVSLFFLCSGFVIPISIERKGGLGTFWWRRFFRLYPLYWVSLLAAIVFVHADLPVAGEGFTDRLIFNAFANATMLQGWLGIPQALPVYWSLGFEMVFYFMFSLLVLAKKSAKTESVVGTLLLASLLLPGVFLLLGRRPLVGTTFHFATMFFGTLFYRHYMGITKDRTLALFFVSALSIIVIVNFYSFYLHPEFWDEAGVRRFWPMTSAWLGGYLLFFASYRMRWLSYGTYILAIGRMSYSIYLIHPLIMAGFASSIFGSWTFPLWLGLVFSLSSVTYSLIEKPAISFSRREFPRGKPLKV